MDETKYLLFIYNIAVPGEAKALNAIWRSFRRRADLVAIGPDHFALIVRPGYPERTSA